MEVAAGEAFGDALGLAGVVLVGVGEAVGLGVGDAVGDGEVTGVGVGEGELVGVAAGEGEPVGVPCPGQVCERRIPEFEPSIVAKVFACTRRSLSRVNV